MSSQATRTFLVYTQPDDPASEAAIRLILERGFPVQPLDFTKLPAGAQEAYAIAYKGNEALPKIMFNGELIGGVDDLKLFFASPYGQDALKDVVMPPILAKRLSPTAKLPTRGSPESIGLDLYADLGIGESVVLSPHSKTEVPTGWGLRAPPGHYLRVAPKSGLAVDKALDVLAGVIDRDYTGQIVVIVATHGHENVEIKHGQKIAQIIAERATVCDVQEVQAFSATVRGDGGFGSTGA